MNRCFGLAALLLLTVGCEVDYLAAPVTDAGPPPAPAIVTAASPMAAIVGGGLLVTRDERYGAIADLDRDIVWLVDLEAMTPHARIDLEPGDRPNRLVEDGFGRVHVALRRGGAVVAIDVLSGELVRRTAVCPAPRGVDYDPARNVIAVACLDGDLIELDAETHAERRRIAVTPDLRDVVVDGERVLVSTFRSAEVFAVDGAGAVEAVPTAIDAHPSGFDGPRTHQPRVAWRMVRGPDGVELLHQRHRAEALPDLPAPNQYYSASNCSNAVLHSTVATVGVPHRDGRPPAALRAGLVVDAVRAFDGRLVLAEPMFDDWVASRPRSGCFDGDGPAADTPIRLGNGVVAVARWHRFALAYDRFDARLFTVATPDGAPSLLSELRFDIAQRADTGHRLFHTPTSSLIACASCHPEGGEDGHVWVFEAFGPRRTQTLHGGISGRAPLHWSGDLADFDALMSEVFVSRMGGVDLHPVETQALAAWVDTVPHLPTLPVIDRAAVDRGAVVFDAAGCRECHFTDGTVDPENHDVGTGEPLQVPSLLGAAHRLPLMHDGCAPDLAARFDPACGGDAHGQLDALTPAARADLVHYLRAL